MKFKDFLNESPQTSKDIIGFVKNNSYLEYDEGKDEDSLRFITRQNGNVSEETPGQKDIQECKRIAQLLIKKFNNINCKIDDVDEWSELIVEFKKESKTEFFYTFKKDDNGRGFSETYENMEKLIEKRGDWVKVDWKRIKKDLKKKPLYNTFNKDDFSGTKSATPMLIKSKNEKDNTSGYNFYIIKSVRVD